MWISLVCNSGMAANPTVLSQIGISTQQRRCLRTATFSAAKRKCPFAGMGGQRRYVLPQFLGHFTELCAIVSTHALRFPDAGHCFSPVCISRFLAWTTPLVVHFSTAGACLLLPWGGRPLQGDWGTWFVSPDAAEAGSCSLRRGRNAMGPSRLPE